MPLYVDTISKHILITFYKSCEMAIIAYNFKGIKIPLTWICRVYNLSVHVKIIDAVR